MRRTVIILLVCCCLAAVVFVAISLRAPRVVPNDSMPVVAYHGNLREHATEVNAVDTLDLTGGAATAENVRGVLLDAVSAGVGIVEARRAEGLGQAEGSVDARLPDPPIPVELRESLVETITTHLLAQAAASPDAYVALAKSEPTEYIDPTSPAWKAIDVFMQYHLDRPAQRDDPQGELGNLIKYMRHGPEGQRIIGAGSNADGVVILTGRTRNPADIDRPLTYELLAGERYAWFYFPGSHSIRMRNPIVSPREIAQRDGRIDYAQSVILVQNHEGNSAFWYATWYFDPKAGVWLNHRSSIRNPWRGFGWVY